MINAIRIMDALSNDRLSVTLMDSIRLNRLSDPTFKIHYRIRANGNVLMDEPWSALMPNLRMAIDFARAKQDEIPFCPVCKSFVNEAYFFSDRWNCPGCKTSFVWHRKPDPAACPPALTYDI